MTKAKVNTAAVARMPLLAAAIGFACSSSPLGSTSGTGGVVSTGGNSQSGGAGGAGGNLPWDGGPAYADQLAAAEATWAAAKPRCPVYRYQRRFTSVFGSCDTTTIEIAADQPIARAFVNESNCYATLDAGVVEQWSELGAQQIGTHADGAPARTVEQLFAECQQILAADPSQYGQFFFSADSNGVPACSTTLTRCIDDCTSAVEILSFMCEVTEGSHDASAD